MINDFVNWAEAIPASECSWLIRQEKERADSCLIKCDAEVFIFFNYSRCQFCEQAEEHTTKLIKHCNCIMYVHARRWMEIRTKVSSSDGTMKNCFAFVVPKDIRFRSSTLKEKESLYLTMASCQEDGVFPIFITDT